MLLDQAEQLEGKVESLYQLNNFTSLHRLKDVIREEETYETAFNNQNKINAIKVAT